jgi:hypothetical protein
MYLKASLRFFLRIKASKKRSWRALVSASVGGGEMYAQGTGVVTRHPWRSSRTLLGLSMVALGAATARGAVMAATRRA